MNGEQVPAEVYLQNKAQHRHVIEIYEHFTTVDHYVYVMERPESCEDLRHVLHRNGPLTEKKAKRYFRQILEANINSEEQGVLRRDLKPENMLLDFKTDEIKLIDFGLASEVQCEPFQSFRGKLKGSQVCSLKMLQKKIIIIKTRQKVKHSRYIPMRQLTRLVSTKRK